jgi:molecular chaperone HtpG
MTAEKREFRTEVKQLLDLMIHSLYSNKEVFLRELVSNASDAIDRARYESLTNSLVAEDETGWKIRIIADRSAGTLTISDNGIGMTKEEAVEALGTIAHSGTKEFLEALQNKNMKDNPELIGQFGVGFYSSFMVADSITVLSRKAGSQGTPGVKWESAGEGSFTVEEIEKKGKGTDVILHVKEEEKKYLEEWEIRTIIRKYSDFIEHPIVMDVEREEESALDKTKRVKVKKEETLNSMKAIWLKDRTEVTEDEYHEFYKHLTHDHTNPLTVMHYRAEGTSEFTALLYIPSTAPFNILYKDYQVGPVLYVKRVQIMDHCEELIPPYLRFVKGVIDSADLPLNVSREILQNNRQVEIIKSNVTKKVLDTLSEMMKADAGKYRTFYKEFGRILKEGIHYDFPRREAIADLLLFPSTKTEGDSLRTIEEYTQTMPEGQKDIYYATGSSLTEVLRSPYLEVFRDKGYEVLVFLDDVDDFLLNSFEYHGRKMKNILRGDIDLGISEDGSKEKSREKYGKLIDLMKERLKEEVKDVRLSGRLTDSACCLVTEEGDIDPQMEKLLKAMGQEVPESKRILEINPAHPLFAAMNGIFEKDRDNPLLQEYIDLIYNQALLLEGSKPKDPAEFAKAVAKLMVENASRSA